METIVIKNKEEKIARRKEIVRKAIRIRDIARFFGGPAMDYWDKKNCPRYKRWLWQIHNNAQTTIWNTNLEIGWLTHNGKFAKNLT